MASEEDSGGSTSAAQPTELYPPAEAYQTAWALYQSKEQQQSSASRYCIEQMHVVSELAAEPLHAP